MPYVRGWKKTWEDIRPGDIVRTLGLGDRICRVVDVNYAFGYIVLHVKGQEFVMFHAQPNQIVRLSPEEQEMALAIFELQD